MSGTSCFLTESESQDNMSEIVQKCSANGPYQEVKIEYLTCKIFWGVTHDILYHGTEINIGT